MQIPLLLSAYLVGSIPTGYLLAKYFFSVDLTRHGSGNIGATNAARVIGKKYFLIVFSLDFSKAFLFLALLIPSPLAAVALLVGNAYSPFLNFKGGKGVATSAGILAALFPVAVLAITTSIWVALIIYFRRVDVASLLSLLLTTILTIYFQTQELQLLLLFMNCLVVWRHRKNMVR